MEKMIVVIDGGRVDLVFSNSKKDIEILVVDRDTDGITDLTKIKVYPSQKEKEEVYLYPAYHIGNKNHVESVFRKFQS